MINDKESKELEEFITKELEDKGYEIEEVATLDDENGYFINFRLADKGITSFYIDVTKKELSKKPFRALYINTKDIENKACEDEYDYDVEMDDDHKRDVIKYLVRQIENYEMLPMNKEDANDMEFDRIYKETHETE